MDMAELEGLEWMWEEASLYGVLPATVGRSEPDSREPCSSLSHMATVEDTHVHVHTCVAPKEQVACKVTQTWLSYKDCY